MCSAPAQSMVGSWNWNETRRKYNTMANQCMEHCWTILTFLSLILQAKSGPETHYLLYSVNPGEGFNLRRDVYMRAATLVRELRKTEDWVLVLPPWPHLHHWKTNYLQTNLKWEKFFDLPSLNEYVPVIEFEDFLTKEGRIIDEVNMLQNFAEGWTEFSERYEERPCIGESKYTEESPGVWRGYIYGYGYDDVVIKSFRCVSVLGFVKTLLPHLQGTGLKSIMMERLENVMHTQFGGRDYWLARKSMVYARHLREAGSNFMNFMKESSLNYDPGSGKGRSQPSNGGGDFMSVHLRRADYIRARPGAVPSLKGAAKQLNILKKELNLNKVFLASDATEQEKEELKSMVEGLVWYMPRKEELARYGSGGVAIIDQWIASHAQYFIGSHESTFSFRIREDRQMMGFSKESTFNNLCGSRNGGDEYNPHGCDEPSYWRIDDSVRKELESDQRQDSYHREQAHKEL